MPAITVEDITILPRIPEPDATRDVPGAPAASVFRPGHDEAAPRHHHRWEGVDFYLEGGHPFVRQSCACGAERRSRAWEVVWDPGPAPQAR